MVTNASLTVYHKSGLDPATRFEKWTRHNYQNVWFFGGRSATVDTGYTDANNVQVRIPYKKNDGLNSEDFAIGDILVEGTLELDIEKQEDLKNYLIYNITSLKNNTFGSEPHIHIGGK